ncbi:MAG: tRNA (N(6)-L-threonylcarbamoyladenosine(37)-C(2))-methylthiotransferase MtaB [Armatimonadetes bacterium]|nr:tRNA (N(6)-L-threonylcarbamoyladenosine(37)-C(2))-methylthiotransferase MtaB [Armatimonadota bacterium]
MPRAAFTTLGCKVNQYETQKILESFAEAGFDVVPFDAVADVYVLNTCSVTGQAESKSRYAVRRARRSNPDAKVVVTGCAAQMALNTTGQGMDGADLTVPNPDKAETLAAFLSAFPEIRPSGQVAARERPRSRSRATLKVQDGCDVLCSYCSIPFTRPGMKSRPWTDVLDEARNLAAQGYQEAVLTGVLIGAYGPESGSGGPGFEELVEMLALRSGLDRLRISSIEVHQVTDRIIGLATDGLVAPHFHVPLQSGDDVVLKDMNRRYDRTTFLTLVENLYRRVPDVSVTTDVMVGFPTETPERFASSVDVLERSRFLKAHVFRFSPRPGTPADAWGDPVAPEDKQERAKTLAEIGERTGREHSRRFLGRTLRAVVENRPGRDGLYDAVTDNWISVKVNAPASAAGTSSYVRLEEEVAGTVFGELTAASSPVSSLRTAQVPSAPLVG